VKEIRRYQRWFGIVGKDVRVVTLRGSDALTLFDVLERAQQVAIGRSLLECSFSAAAPMVLRGF